MSKQVLVTDVDFVLLDWVAGLKPFLKEKGMEHEHIDKYIGSTYYPTLEELFLEKDEAINILLMKEFNKSYWIEHLPIFQEDSRKHLEKLSEDFDIVALTCLGTEANQKEKRVLNLEERYGKVFHDIACIELRESKEDYLTQLAKDRVVVGFIDDRIKHLNEGINAGIEPLLYVRNAEIPETNIEIVSCWSEVGSKLKENQKLSVSNSTPKRKFR